MLSRAEKLRHDVAGKTDRSHKSAMGQFMTPASVATYMAGLFKEFDGPISLLDPGAGLGALSCAVLDRWHAGGLGPGRISVQAFEVDERLSKHLQETLETYEQRLGADIHCSTADYLKAACSLSLSGIAPYTHAILNPPYKKIGIDSEARAHARRVGLETVNLYSAFVGMALTQLQHGGQLVAIIPRSFCNGPYYKPFRKFILERAALRHIHLFDSRSKAFRDDEVLQENIIVYLERGGIQGDVTISLSTDDAFDDVVETIFSFNSVVRPDDAEVFIRFPSSGEDDLVDSAPKIASTLIELGLSVSTGPVVDFRVKEHLRASPESDTVPLLYPGHFNGMDTLWPIDGFKKSNAIALNSDTEKWTYPSGTYTVVRRFSSKEEKRRIVAYVVSPESLGMPKRIAFENHLNVFHEGKRGLSEAVAWGMFVYLNSTAVDEHFRRFNGHTQVNATDLKNIRYPPRDQLEEMGRWAIAHDKLSQQDIDGYVENLFRT